MEKAEPLDLSHHFSSMAKRRTESSVSKFLFAVPITRHNIGPGFPFAGNFPVDTLEGAIAEPRRFPLHPITAVSLPDTDTSRFTIPKVSMDAQSGDPAAEIDLATALQYQSSTGYPSLAAFVQDWAVNHQNQGKIPYKDPQTLITGGAQDAFGKCLLTFADVGDSILVEEYVYFSARDQMLPFGINVVPVKLDEQGMSARSLEHILQTWNEKKQGKKPHMMYTVTIGQNPTGAIMPISRKRQIYELCRKYDIIIFEDDPYWGLQYEIPDEATDEFLGSLAPSYVTIDRDGRVLSLQTFTKIFAPGCRVGWIVAQPAFIEKLIFATDGTTSNPSGFAEAALSQVIIREWGIKGFIRWIEGLRVNYQSRRDVFCEVLSEGRDLIISSKAEHLTEEPLTSTPPGNHKKRRRTHALDESGNQGNGAHASSRRKIRMFSFRVPAGGMYVWADFHLDTHPLSLPATPGKPHLSPEDIMLRLWNHLVSAPYSLLTIPGSVFGATPGVKSATHHLRLTFAAASAEDLRRAARLFNEAVKTFWEGEGWELPTDEEMESTMSGAKGLMRLRGRDDGLTRIVKHHIHRSRTMNLGLAFGRG